MCMTFCWVCKTIDCPQPNSHFRLDDGMTNNVAESSSFDFEVQPLRDTKSMAAANRALQQIIEAEDAYWERIVKDLWPNLWPVIRPL